MTFTTNGVIQWPIFSVDSVSGLCFDSTGNLYVTLPNFYEIARPGYAVGYGYYLGLYEPYTQTHLGYPLSIALDATDVVYAVNGGNTPFYGGFTRPYTNTVEKFNTNFTWLGTVASNLHGAWGCAVDKDGNLYVSTTDDHSIRRYATNGTVTVVSDYFDDWLYAPKGIAFDSLGNLVVANSGNGTVVRFAPNGTSTVIASNLPGPTSIAVWPGLKLWRVPIKLKDQTVLPGGEFQFSFVTNPYGTNTVEVAGDATGGWTTLGAAVEVSPGEYQFTDSEATNSVQRFYRVLSE